MVVVDILAFAAGAVMVFLTISSAVRTMVVPRATPSNLSRAVFIAVRRAFRLRAGRRHSF